MLILQIFHIPLHLNQVIKILLIEYLKFIVVSMTNISLQNNSISGGNVFSPNKKEMVKLEILEQNPQENSILINWDNKDYNSPLLNEKTLKGYIVSATLELNLMLKNFHKSVLCKLPIYFKVVESTIEFEESAKLLQQFKNLLKEKSYGELSGSLFSLSIIPSNELTDGQSSVTAIIDAHNENMEKLGNVLETERIKQELELHEKLTPANKKDLGKKLQLAARLSHLKVSFFYYKKDYFVFIRIKFTKVKIKIFLLKQYVIFRNILFFKIY